MLGSSRAKPLADLVRFEAIKKDEAVVARPDGGHPVGSKRLPGSGTIPLQIRRDRIYEPYAQVGGFASRADAQKALRKVIERLGPAGRGTMTLGELVDEYLEMHQAEPVTIAKLRWLLGKGDRHARQARFTLAQLAEAVTQRRVGVSYSCLTFP